VQLSVPRYALRHLHVVRPSVWREWRQLAQQSKEFGKMHFSFVYMDRFQGLCIYNLGYLYIIYNTSDARWKGYKMDLKFFVLAS
jgi:hypothetical protein